MDRRLAFRSRIPPEPGEMALRDDDHGAGHLAEHVEVDSDDAASEVSSILSENESQTTSLRSVVFDYTYENGRRYHGYRAGQYLLPNDELEQERLDMAHHVFTLALGGALSVTQLRNPQAILDIGTGTGMWTIETGDMFPSAEVIGTDLSPIQSEWVPPNVKFQIDDATLPWTFPENRFDFIHVRELGGAVHDWPALLEQCYNHCKPGGSVEISEMRSNIWCDDGTMAEDTATYKWISEFRRLSAPLLFDIAPSLPDMLRDAGFQDVAYTQKILPIGTWPKDPALKEVGAWFMALVLEMGLEAFTLALFTRTGNWSNAEVQVLLALVRQELRSNKVHAYTYTAFATGRKPLSPGTAASGD